MATTDEGCSLESLEITHKTSTTPVKTPGEQEEQKLKLERQRNERNEAKRRFMNGLNHVVNYNTYINILINTILILMLMIIKKYSILYILNSIIVNHMIIKVKTIFIIYELLTTLNMNFCTDFYFP